MSLPVTKTKRSINPLHDLTMVYSRAGEGKSYLANTIPGGTLFLDFDNGLRGMDVYSVECFRADGYKAYVETIQQLSTMSQADRDALPYKTVTIDTITKCLASIEEAVVKQHKAKDINSGEKLSYGKGYKMVKDIFLSGVQALRLSGWGVFLIAHSQNVEMTDEFGAKYMQEVPAMAKSYRTAVEGECDHIVRISTVHDVFNGQAILKRVLTGQPSMTYTAKSRGGIYSYNMLANWEVIGTAYANNSAADERAAANN